MTGKIPTLATVSALAAAFFATLSAYASPQQGAPDVTGPHKVLMHEEPSLPNHTVYRPASLQGLKSDSLPVVVWGNGACGNAGNAFERYLAEIASHGFLVIANGPIEATPFGRPPPPGTPMPSFPAGGRPAGGAPPPPSSSVTQMLDAISWAQKADTDGPLKGLIDTAHVAVAGQSCGGLQALSAAADPRVTTAVIVNSGVVRQGPPAASNGPPRPTLSMPTPDLSKLHTPLIYIIGGPSDIAHANANADFDEIKTLPLFRADLDVGHNGTLYEPHGGKFAEVATAWLTWRLKGDATAGRTFVGADCGLCRASEWTVKKKNLN